MYGSPQLFDNKPRHQTIFKDEVRECCVCVMTLYPCDMLECRFLCLRLVDPPLSHQITGMLGHQLLQGSDGMRALYTAGQKRRQPEADAVRPWQPCFAP